MTNSDNDILLLGRRIYTLRRARGLSQNDFAEITAISREHLAKIETGKRCPSVKLLFKIAKALDMKLSDVLDIC